MGEDWQEFTSYGCEEQGTGKYSCSLALREKGAKVPDPLRPVKINTFLAKKHPRVNKNE
jgi:hypothetical protein